MTERKMKDGFWMLLCAACLLLSARSVQARELTALDIFAQLPITLFENTPEGLSEDEKLRLIEPELFALREDRFLRRGEKSDWREKKSKGKENACGVLD